MTRVLIKPISRSVGRGAHATFAVAVEDGDGLTLRARACDEAPDYEVSLGGEEQEVTAGSEPVTLGVAVPKDAAMA